MLLAASVVGFAWLGCNRLQPAPPSPPSPRCSPLPALLPTAALVLHCTWRHARWLHGGGGGGGGSGKAVLIAPPPVLALPSLVLTLAARLSTLALLWLQLERPDAALVGSASAAPLDLQGGGPGGGAAPTLTLPLAPTLAPTRE